MRQIKVWVGGHGLVRESVLGGEGSPQLNKISFFGWDPFTIGDPMILNVNLCNKILISLFGR